MILYTDYPYRVESSISYDNSSITLEVKGHSNRWAYETYHIPINQPEKVSKNGVLQFVLNKLRNKVAKKLHVKKWTVETALENAVSVIDGLKHKNKMHIEKRNQIAEQLEEARRTISYREEANKILLQEVG